MLSALEADGVALHPSPAALRFAQDKLAMRHRLTEIDVACPAWAQARTAADVDEFAKQVGWPIVAKTPRGGYDGKGVRVVSSAAELEDWLEQVARDAVDGGLLADGLLLEEKVDFTASWPCSSPAALPTRRLPGRWWRPCRPTASAPRCWPGAGTSTRTWPRWPPRPGCASLRTSA